MKILLLGYGKEGRAAEEYFKSRGAEIDIHENFTPDTLRQGDYSRYDIIFRSPSVPPLHLPNESSITRYFYEHCPCPIIGVTATKGKGTTCSFIKSLLDAHGEDAYLVGNIGVPAITVLDNLTASSVVVYEMSSFQLWDLTKSPSVAVLGQLEPDHLNVHRDYADYLAAKSHICRYQSASDYLVYYKDNPTTVELSATSPARKIPYPFPAPASITSAITLPGEHNRNNALAAIAAVASFLNISPDEYLQKFPEEIKQGLSSFHGLPHRLEFLRNFSGVDYYDDNFSTNPSSTRVAVNSFLNRPTTIIVGGRDKTNNEDLPEIYEILQSPNIKHIILLGESGHALAKEYHDDRFVVVESLSDAVIQARTLAESLVNDNTTPVVLMSPSAASFDMFRDVYDRGAQFQDLVQGLR